MGKPSPASGGPVKEGNFSQKSRRGGRGGKTGGRGTPRPKRNGDNSGNRKTQVKTKLILRNIPFTMSNEQFMDFINSNELLKPEHLLLFVQGKERSGSRCPIPGRAYFSYKKEPELATKVIDSIQGVTLPDAKGIRVPITIQYAPYQKVPREKNRRDPRAGTIDKDPDYKAFMENLQAPQEKLPSAEIQINLREAEGVDIVKPVAPLIQYLIEKRAKKTSSREKGKGRSKGGLYGDSSKRKSKNKNSKSDKSKSSKRGNAASPVRKKSSGNLKKKEEVRNISGSRGVKAKGTKREKNQEKLSDTKKVQPGMFKIMPSKSTNGGENSEGSKKNVKPGQGRGRGRGYRNSRGGRGGGKNHDCGNNEGSNKKKVYARKQSSTEPSKIETS